MSMILKRAERFLTEARSIHEAAEQAKRDLTPEERSQYDNLMDAAKRAAQDAEFEHQVTRQLGSAQPELRAVVRGSTAAAPCEARAAGNVKDQRATLLPSFGEYRAAQAEGTDSLGGYTVPEQVAGTIVDRLRAGSVFLQAQPRIFTMGSDVLRIPKIGASASVAMVAENAAIPESNLTFAGTTLTARKIAGLVRSSNEWLSDSVPNARQIIEADLMNELGRKLDEQFFGGNGTPPNMQGLLTDPSLTPTTGVGAITLDHIALAVESVETAGGTPTAIFMGPAVFSVIRRLKDGDDRYQLNPDPTGEARRRLFGLDVYLTPFLSNAVIVADMSQIAVGVRDRVTLFYDDSRYAEYDQSLVRLTARFDLGVLNAAAVKLLTGITF